MTLPTLLGGVTTAGIPGSGTLDMGSMALPPLPQGHWPNTTPSGSASR